MNSFKAGTVVVISVPWRVPRNRPVDAHSLVGREQRTSQWSTEGRRRGNIPGVWRQLEAIHADFCGFEVSN